MAFIAVWGLKGVGLHQNTSHGQISEQASERRDSSRSFGRRDRRYGRCLGPFIGWDGSLAFAADHRGCSRLHRCDSRCSFLGDRRDLDADGFGVDMAGRWYHDGIATDLRRFRPTPNTGQTTSCPYGPRAGVLRQESCSSFRLSAVGGWFRPIGADMDSRCCSIAVATWEGANVGDGWQAGHQLAKK